MGGALGDAGADQPRRRRGPGAWRGPGHGCHGTTEPAVDSEPGVDSSRRGAAGVVLPAHCGAGPERSVREGPPRSAPTWSVDSPPALPSERSTIAAGVLPVRAAGPDLLPSATVRAAGHPGPTRALSPPGRASRRRACRPTSSRTPPIRGPPWPPAGAAPIALLSPRCRPWRPSFSTSS
ncbi:hypothetical protein NKG94_20160 [Micromonospora sp. M12]